MYTAYRNRLASVRPSISSQQPLNASSLLQNPNDSKSVPNDVIFYEYDIVDKKGEERYLMEQLQTRGLCVCSRWLFVLLGNLVILLIIGAIIGILYYVNIPPDPTKAPLTFNQTCINGSTTCNTVANLQCLNARCGCASGTVWNGTDCICNVTTSFWDGSFCSSYRTFGQSCNMTTPCVSYLLCDNTTLTCNCSFGKYYQSGACINQLGFSVSGCTSFIQCQFYLGLTCSATSSCVCNTGFYYDTTQCVQQLTFNAACPSNVNFASACNASASLLPCSSAGVGTCACCATCYWDGSACVAKRTYNQACTSNNMCDSTFGLVCGTGTCQCGSPLTSAGNCDCPNGQFWDGQRCLAKKAASGTCLSNFYCTSNNCQFGLCQ